MLVRKDLCKISLPLFIGMVTHMNCKTNIEQTDYIANVTATFRLNIVQVRSQVLFLKSLFLEGVFNSLYSKCVIYIYIYIYGSKKSDSMKKTKTKSKSDEIIIIIIYSFRVFHISVSWWFFTEVGETASLLKSPGLFLVFWPFSIMLSFG